MARYTEFITGIRGEYNVIEYGGNGGAGAELYLSIKGLLKWISEFPNMFSQTSQIVKIDWESDKPMFMYSTTISCNLEKCYMRNQYLGTSRGTIGGNAKAEETGGISYFRPIEQFDALKYNKLQDKLKEEANATTYPSIYPSLGNINNIYVNVIYLSEILAKKSDNKDNKVSVREFLQTLCDGINKALGSINDLQVIIDVDGIEETLTIIDYQQKRIKNLDTPRREPTELKAQGLGSMLTNIQAQSSITPEIADMISIGAQAQEQTVGEEATSFSLLSKGFRDRIYPTKKIGKQTILEQQQKAEKAINDRFTDAIKTYNTLISNQRATGGVYDPIKIASTDQSNKENIAVELYKACLGKFTQTGQTSTAFIPIKLDISLYGLAGIKIYQKFKLSNDILPLSYKGNFEFIILGISHTVDTSKWETTISALISIKDEKIEKESKTLAPFAIPLNSTSGATNSTTTGTTLSFSAFPRLSTTSPDFLPGFKDFALQVNPNKIGRLLTTGNAPVAKALANRGINNARLKVTDKTQLVPIVGGDGRGLTRYKAGDPTGQTGYLLYPAAALAWANAYRELTNAGLTVRVYSAYRDLQHQRSLPSEGTATAGSSPHGWGMALDISPFDQLIDSSPRSALAPNKVARTTEFYRKVGEIMAKHNWYNPWRLADNAGTMDEVWHWEYWGTAEYNIIPGVTSLETLENL